MHSRMASTDSDLALRRNPLMITQDDGTDFVFDLKHQEETNDGYGEELDDLQIAEMPQPTPPTNSGIDYEFDFGGDLAAELGKVTLSRHNTIAARKASKKLETRPSTNNALIQRLRSLRKKRTRENLPLSEESHSPDPAVDLPDNVLEMMAYSSPIPTPLSESSEFDVKKTDSPSETSKSAKNEPESQPARKSESGHLWRELLAPLPTSQPEPSKEPHFEPQPQPEPLVQSSDSEEPQDKPQVIKQAARPQLEVEPNIAEIDPVSKDDRGRLFLQIDKLMGLRGLPLDLRRNPRFTLTLDNGLQCVTTTAIPITSPNFNGEITVKVNQEFELMVAEDLELVLTIAVQMDALQPPPKPRFVPPTEPKPSPVEEKSPKKSVKSFFKGHSPKKSLQHKQEQALALAQEQFVRDMKGHEIAMSEYRRKSGMWRKITGNDGEFGRGYLFESHYEREIYGAVKSYTIPCYNEWESPDCPKHCAGLQITMMYVPKLFANEELPTSLKQAQDQLNQAMQKKGLKLQGYLTQNGGDCNMWRRRYFTLNGNELIAHHEASHRRRLLIDLREALSVKEALSDDLWCIYEDRSFQITFIDGEAISFYADTVEERIRWVWYLQQNLANCTGKQQCWTDLVLEKRSS